MKANQALRFLFSFLLACASLFAHHGTSVTYQVEKTITLSGVATEFVYGYPHPQLYFDVKDADGRPRHWGAEFGPTPLMMKNMKAGWSRDSIKPGDAIAITCNPHKLPNAQACLLKELVVNGKALQVTGANPAPAQTPPAHKQ